MITTHQLIGFFVHYKYAAIFPIAVLEGPIITIISGFLVSRSILSFLGAFLVTFLGDLISDSVFYAMGRKGREFVHKFGWLHITDERIARIEEQYERSPWKTMIVAKVSYGIGAAFMVASGISKMSFQKFLQFAGLLNAVRSFLLILVGYYFGRIAIRNGSKYISWYTTCVIIAAIAYVSYRLIRKYRNKKQSRAAEEKHHSL